ncbi:DUF1289 domain-containing protein [Paraneptunicella aestuarii]|uniref:DUF1289 domain-containing protein n=1 Tax=Paraneptunicella aestuarii TaxID=2831148 RepID=UPI001E328A67|nr:DUF1289 domain-containing protein [Paraneptunicella aestuarii]UAA38060.1 DUF1289 domain-containing protein [Paraneptunicella aestuarii]
MKQIEIFEIPSPCIGVCQAGPNGFCLGCFRSRDERLHWQKLDDDVKRKILKACAMRRKRAERAAMKKDGDAADKEQMDLWGDNSPKS